jgi:hypothetical protein
MRSDISLRIFAAGNSAGNSLTRKKQLGYDVAAFGHLKAEFPRAAASLHTRQSSRE